MNGYSKVLPTIYTTQKTLKGEKWILNIYNPFNKYWLLYASHYLSYLNYENEKSHSFIIQGTQQSTGEDRNTNVSIEEINATLVWMEYSTAAW